ncbi:hypothetical protein BWI93_05170 [Siphonobacter sp. BAB-5385]|nr:hypothetical protein BWI93_05170 [Siphonobacter sp. BAB-5385]
MYIFVIASKEEHDKCNTLITCNKSITIFFTIVSLIVMKPIESQRLIQVRGELTQEEFASRIGLNRVNISNIENGIQAMSIKTAKLIKEHFGVSLDWLYGYTDDNQIAYTPVAMPDDKDLTIEVLSKSLEECQKDKVFLQGLIDKLSK